MPSLLSNLKSAREWATPTLKSSAFLSRGVLTPEEFVAAGDELTFRCPTWTWEAGDPSRRKKHLPADKQFLMTRNVPCAARVSSLENAVADEMGGGGGKGCLGEDDDDDGDWLVSRILTAEEVRHREEAALEDGFDILDGEGEVVAADAAEDDVAEGVAKLSVGEAGPGAKDDGGDVDDEYTDMADFEDDDVMEDEAAVTSSAPSPTADDDDDDGDNENILRVRSYDVSITYDKYYQTPRVWLTGYADDGSNTPLTGQEMMEDVISDYANRTVTVEEHPHVRGAHASVHPCQHGAVMKTIVRNLTRESSSGGGGGGGRGNDGNNNDGPTVEMYLFIFLKFVSSMIPTISYDFTMDVSASTKK
eukprot:CAMPEP_0181140868 /NCGR_PEP_ID=MMETSP1071-20121207/35526_1 /TAXON_ID=35127 /ORGANISM="Thalassiosira sp., Strain NH16" /LENGTH=361 /DNA_ID=CAMNT_0023227833 /DNA_START=20 /DNA_END=1105 /DNA_ORIENTATION=-